MNAEERFQDLVNKFDINDLRLLVIRMSKGYNGPELLKMAESVADRLRIPGVDSIRETVRGIVDADRMEFFGNCGPTPRGYVESMDYAYDWILEHLTKEFGKIARILDTRGMDYELDEMMLYIADELEEADGLINDESPDACPQLSRHIRECVENGEPLKGFEW